MNSPRRDKPPQNIDVQKTSPKKDKSVAQSIDGHIRVVCRFRPQDQREFLAGGVEQVNFQDDSVFTKEDNFTFDKIFTPASSQHDIFQYSAASIVDDIMSGYNGTLLAYGQTGYCF
jgi:kinesin family protein 5